MGTTTTTFALNKPTVGGDDNAWGTDWNTNADKIDDLLDGTTAIKPNLSEGLWKVGGTAVTSTAAELNVLDGIPGTLTATELGYVDGVTSAIQTQINAKAPIASPTFTGVPAAPTAAVGTNTTQLATTAFALEQVIDEDNFATDSATRPPSQQSAKAYIAAQIAAIDVFALTAALTAGAVGTYAFCSQGTANFTFGGTYAGSGLLPASVASNPTSGGSALDGTWRSLGFNNSGAARYTLYVRIA